MPWVFTGTGSGKGGGKGGKRRGGGRLRGPPEVKVWIGGLSEETKWKDLQTHMDQAGKSSWVEVFGGQGAGTGAVVYKTAEEATNAVATLNGSVLGGKNIIVDPWVPRPKEEGAAPAVG